MVFKFEMQPNQNLVNLLGVQLCIRDLGVNAIFHYFIRTEVFISDVICHRSIQVVVVVVDGSMFHFTVSESGIFYNFCEVWSSIVMLEYDFIVSFISAAFL